MSSTANRVIKNTGFLYAKMGITMFISLYTTRLILNSLGASDFGIFNIVGGAIAMLGFLNTAMASATQRFMSYSEGEGDKEKQKSIFNVSLILHLGISIIVGITLFIAGYFFFNGILNIPENRISAAQIVYGSLIVSTIFTVMTVPYDAAMNAHENMKYYAIVGILESLLKLAVALACVYTAYDKLIVYGILMACIPLITLTIMRIYCHKHYRECIISPKKYWKKGLMKEMTSFAGWNFMSTASSMIANYGMGILINHFFGTLLNAAQGIANQINGQIMGLSNNFIKATAPVMGKSAGKKDLIVLQKTTIESTRITTILYCMISIPIFLYAPYIFSIWLKDVPDWTILFSKFIILINLIEFQYLSLVGAVRAIGVINNMSKYTFIINIISLPVVYFLFNISMPPYTLYLVLLIVKLSLLANVMFNVRKYCDITFKNLIRNIIFPLNAFFLIVVTALYCILLFFGCNNLTTFLINLSSFFIIFTLGVFLIINKNEKNIVKNIIYKLLNK